MKTTYILYDTYHECYMPVDPMKPEFSGCYWESVEDGRYMVDYSTTLYNGKIMEE